MEQYTIDTLSEGKSNNNTRAIPDQLEFNSIFILCSVKVFFDIEIAGEAKGRITMQLRSDVVPKTAENFRQVT